MKQVIAFIKPAVLERVTDALREIDGLSGMSMVDNYGFGRYKGAARRSADSEISYFQKNLRVEIMVSDTLVWTVVDTIQKLAWAGEYGEGKIYVIDLVEAVRIRTNERGEAAV